MNILQLDEVDSTNNELKRLLAKGAPEWTVVCSHKQTAGRGRYDRKWESVEGNLFLSLLVKPAKIHSNIALVVGLAALNAAKLFDKKSDFKLKWPNDILKDGKKLGGILIEAENNNIIIGLGFNIKSAPNYAQKLDADLNTFRDAFLSSFKKYYEIWNKSGFKTLKNEWLASAAYLQEKITIKLENTEVAGVFKGVNDEGEMILDNNGKELIISSGEIYGC